MTTQTFGRGYHDALMNRLQAAQPTDLAAVVDQSLTVMPKGAVEHMSPFIKLQHICASSYSFVAYRYNDGDRPFAPKTSSWWSTGVVANVVPVISDGGTIFMVDILRSSGWIYPTSRYLGEECYFIDPNDIVAARKAFKYESENYADFLRRLVGYAKKHGLDPPDEREEEHANDDIEQRYAFLEGYKQCMLSAAARFKAILLGRKNVYNIENAAFRLLDEMARNNGRGGQRTSPAVAKRAVLNELELR